MQTTYLTWRFKTDNDYFGDLKKLLAPATKCSWIHYSTERNDRVDWLGATIGDKAELRFYERYMGILDAVLKVATEDAEHDERIAAARNKVLSEILPIVGAREIEEIETTIHRY
ncbi:MAG TPA: hypothetical protein PKI03_00500 [Pseudomonadota bacterium]|nr:hypothetical protein [Pseudomonadota bacterium]